MKDIKELSLEELKQKSQELRDQLYHLRVQKQLGKLEKTHQLSLIKKQIARLNTERSVKEREGAAL